MKILVITLAISIFIHLLAYSVYAEEAVEQQAKTMSELEIQAIQQDGKAPVRVFGRVYSIDKSEPNCILEDGKTMQCFSEDSLPHATKIFRVTTKGPSGEKLYLAVWFALQDGRLWGHKRGLYLYDPNDFNAWDKVVGATKDVTVFKDQLLSLQRNRIKHFIESSVWETGNQTGQSLPFYPQHFINLGETLYIIGRTAVGSIYRKYLYMGKGRPPLYLHDISAQELRVLRSSAVD